MGAKGITMLNLLNRMGLCGGVKRISKSSFSSSSNIVGAVGSVFSSSELQAITGRSCHRCDLSRPCDRGLFVIRLRDCIQTGRGSVRITSISVCALTFRDLSSPSRFPSEDRLQSNVSRCMILRCEDNSKEKANMSIVASKKRTEHALLSPNRCEKGAIRAK